MISRGFLIALLTAAAALAQPRPQFDAASVKASDPGLDLVDNYLPNLRADHGRLRFANIPLQNLIMLAYGLGKGQISAPGTLTAALKNRYDVVATLPAGAVKEQVAPMLQDLLAERFNLKVHRDNRVIPLYAMVVAAGPKLEAVPDEGGESGCSRAFATSPGATHSADCHRMTASDIAQVMTALAPGYFDRPVIDATALTGVYNVKLEWISRAESIKGGDGPTIFKAVERLGLKLEPRKQAMDVIVIDRADASPSAD